MSLLNSLQKISLPCNARERERERERERKRERKREREREKDKHSFPVCSEPGKAGGHP